MDGGWISEGRVREQSADSIVHSGGMGRETVGQVANRFPKGATDPVHYGLLFSCLLIHRCNVIPMTMRAVVMSWLVETRPPK